MESTIRRRGTRGPTTHSFRPRGQRRTRSHGAVVEMWPGSSPLRQASSSRVLLYHQHAVGSAPPFGTGQPQCGVRAAPIDITCRHLMVPHRSRSRSRAPGRSPFRPREITSTFHAIDASFARAACCTMRRRGARRRPSVARVPSVTSAAALVRGLRLQRDVAARS